MSTPRRKGRLPTSQELSLSQLCAWVEGGGSDRPILRFVDNPLPQKRASRYHFLVICNRTQVVEGPFASARAAASVVRSRTDAAYENFLDQQTDFFNADALYETWKNSPAYTKYLIVGMPIAIAYDILRQSQCGTRGKRSRRVQFRRDLPLKRNLLLPDFYACDEDLAASLPRSPLWLAVSNVR